MHNALMRRDRDGDVVTRAATIRPNSFNREARTFAAVDRRDDPAPRPS
jgi:hypothetical protein